MIPLLLCLFLALAGPAIAGPAIAADSGLVVPSGMVAVVPPASAPVFPPVSEFGGGKADIASAAAPLTTAPAPDTFFTLEECLQTALEKNRLIRISAEKVTGAREKRRQVGRTQLPTVSLLTQEQKLKVATSASTRDRQDTHRVTVAESAQLFGRHRAQRRAADATIRVMDAERRRTVLDVTFQVKKAFYDVLLTQDLILVAADSLAQLEAHRDHTERLVKADTAPRFDLIRAEVQVALARPALIRAIRARLTTMADLMHLLGLDPLENAGLVGSFPEFLPEVPQSEEEALAIAVRDRPDLAAAHASEDAARQQVAIARQALQPSLQMTGNLEQTRGLRAPADRYQDQWNVTLGLLFPFFDSGLSRAQTREAQAGLRQAGLNTDQTLSSLKVEIRKAFSVLQEASEVLLSQKMNVEQAMEALSIAQAAYESGARTALDVLDAQMALTQARNLQFQALHDRAVAMAQMEKALGRILPLALDEDGEAEEAGPPVNLASEPAALAPTASTPSSLDH